jgi:predicted MFS family arabinose efflux permease
MFKTIMPLNAIIAMRFLGLFIVLPVISVYAFSLPGATSTTVGIVIGGYAITQMLFQVPFGILSDKIGRKQTLIIGLLIFAIGSVVSAMATDMYTLILGRFLQGAGAIGSVAVAMISDIIKEEQRPKAMALMGGTIAVSFAISMLLGPIIGAATGIETLFYMVSFMALFSIFILIKFVPQVPTITHTYNGSDKYSFLKDSKLIKMNITNFLQKGLMTFAFMIIPIVLIKAYGWQMDELWKVYLPAMIAGIVAMGPAAILAEKKGMFKQVLIVGIVFFAISYYIIGLSGADIASSTISDDYMLFTVGVVVFFMGFNMHEPIMQSLATKYAKIDQKGAILGVFNSFGYLGTFVGGFVGGVYLESVSLETISYAIIVVSLLWVVLIITLPNPSKTKNVYLPLDDLNENKFDNLHSTNGCVEWYINNTENIIIVKYDALILDENKIKNLISN